MTSRAQPVGPWRKHQPQQPRSEYASRYGERGRHIPIEETISAYDRWVKASKERKARRGR